MQRTHHRVDFIPVACEAGFVPGGWRWQSSMSLWRWCRSMRVLMRPLFLWLQGRASQRFTERDMIQTNSTKCTKIKQEGLLLDQSRLMFDKLEDFLNNTWRTSKLGHSSPHSTSLNLTFIPSFIFYILYPPAASLPPSVSSSFFFLIFFLLILHHHHIRII